jgi:hypothetical protein
MHPFKPVLDELLHGVTTLGNAAADEGALVAEARSGQAEFEPEFSEFVAAQIAKSDSPLDPQRGQGAG